MIRPQTYDCKILRQKLWNQVQKEIQGQSAREAKSRPIQKGMDSSIAAIYLRKSSEEDDHSRADHLFDCEKRAEELGLDVVEPEQAAEKASSSGYIKRSGLTRKAKLANV
jgi:hypothetical protein|tara:strand:- start:485 stop:814 length:330 start_codon:yes stop_codon:yes gene_type:complete